MEEDVAIDRHVGHEKGGGSVKFGYTRGLYIFLGTRSRSARQAVPEGWLR
jgi:hypothetical protein